MSPEPGRSATTRRLSRSIGLLGLTFVGIGGMLGSGWLFGPLFAAQSAGPAATVAWLVGGLMMLLTAVCFAETAAMFPVAGGLARQPAFSHGHTAGTVIGWAAWIGYVTQAPIETQAMLEYASNESAFEWLFVGSGPAAGGQNELSGPGILVAVVLLGVFTLINAWGVRGFARLNTQLTWVKIAVPILVAVVLLVSHFDAGNLTDHGGFAPEGVSGVMAAISTGGIAFAFIGFRHVLDLAGETERPQRTVPLALTLSVLICTVLFTAVQLGFLGALDEGDVAGGWAQLGSGGANGPIAALLTALGVSWLATIVLADAVVSPFGAALVSTASTSRLAMAISHDGVFPSFFQRLSARGVPAHALALNFGAGVLIFLVRDGWREVLAFNTGAIVVSFSMGAITALSLRRQLPDAERPFRVPALGVLAPAAFVVTCWIIYWTGWETLWQITVPIMVGVVVYAVRLYRYPRLRREMDLRSMAWFPFFYVGLLALSFAGNFGGGRGWLPEHLDTPVVAVFALATFAVAVRLRLPAGRAHEIADGVQAELADDGGSP